MSLERKNYTESIFKLFLFFLWCKKFFPQGNCMQNLLFIFLLVFSFSSYGEEAIIKASLEGDLQQVNRLISDGANVNARDIFERTALMLASAYGYTEIAEALIGAKADVNARDRDATALMLASAIQK